MLARDLTETVSALAQRLYTVDNDVDLAFVRSHTDGPTRMAQEAREIVAALDRGWLEYGTLVDAASRTPAGSDVVEVVGALRHQLDEIAARAARLAEASRESVRRLDAADAAVRDAVSRAGALGGTADDALTDATAALDDWKTAVADDVAFTDARRFAPRIDKALERIGDLERRWRELPERRKAAASSLDDIERIAAEGAEAFARAQRKVVISPKHLAEPVDGSVVERLRRSLASIAKEAESGAWVRAAERLDRWRGEADGVLRRACDVRRINAAPVRHRDELRGRIEAYRSMAVHTGRAEDCALARLHDEACQELYREPCDLKAAQRLVRAYIAAVHDG